MKNRTSGIFALGLFLGCIAGLSACANPFAQAAASTGKTASLSISIGNPSSRSIVAGDSDYSGAIAVYKVTVAGDGFNQESGALTSGSYSIANVAAGKYTVTARAYSDTTATTQIAEGSVSANIESGKTNIVSVTLAFTQAASTGGFSLSALWPASTGFTHILARLDSTTGSIASMKGGSSDGTNYSATLSSSGLSGGSHVLYIYFKTRADSTVYYGPYMESLNVWDGVTSRM